MEKRKPLYNIGDLFTEFVDGLTLSSGIVTDIFYDKLDGDYVYSVLWNDMMLETEIFEAIIKWRIENEIFGYFPVIK